MNARVKPLRAALRQRGMNLRKLCNVARVQYNHFSGVVAGTRSGRFTWPKIADHLNEAEIELVNLHFGNPIT